MSSSQIIISEASQVLLSPKASSNEQYRLRVYRDWLDANGVVWYQPDLAAYRDYLLYDYVGRDNKPLSPGSARTHLHTIRSRYRALLRDGRTRDYLYEVSGGGTLAEQKAFVDEHIVRLQNAIDPQASVVKIITAQDTPDEKHVRLTIEQAKALLLTPDTNTPLGLRDACMIGLMLCTGVREGELVALDVKDLRRQFGNTLALHVRSGKGRRERLIPYGELIWILEFVDEWLDYSGITEGALFRGFYKGGKTLRPHRLTVRAVNQVLDRYPVPIDGFRRSINPHDLRRTYARMLYEAGVEVLAIRDNLGHTDSRTTFRYIGTMSVEARKPPLIFSFDMSTLQTLTK